jgi:hypothetical protein
MVAVRISDIDEDGRATRITYGMRNLTHDESHENPQPIVPGERRRTRIQLNDVAQRFPQGHRIRVAISTSYWPLAWPAPEPVKLKVFTGECRLGLPVRPFDRADARLGFDEVEAARPHRVEQHGLEEHNWHVVYDLAEDRHTLIVTNDNGHKYLADADLTHGDRTIETYTSISEDFESIAAETHSSRSLSREDWHTEVETRIFVSSDRENFFLDAELDAWEGPSRIFSRNWNRKVPRRLV